MIDDLDRCFPETSIALLDELISLSRVVIIKQDNEGLSAVYQFLPEENEIAEIYDKNFFGLDIKQAFLISPSQKSLSLPPISRLVKKKKP